MEGLYKIGAVSKITGINIPTLRVWENKFKIVEPNRINGTQRGYTKNDLDKLCIVKALIETGDSISSLTGLDINELELRLEKSSIQKKNFTPNETRENISVIVVGTMVPNFDNPISDLPNIRVINKYELSDFSEDEGIIEDSADILIFETPTLHVKTVSWVKSIMDQSSFSKSIILYRFASGDALKAAGREKNINILRQPATSNDIQMMCAFALNSKTEQKEILHIRNNREKEAPVITDYEPFTDKELWEISVMANPIHCECPKHLSSIITSLKGFEKYSADCEELSPEDRIIHEELEKHSVEARMIMEKALRKVIKENSINYSVANAS